MPTVDEVGHVVEHDRPGTVEPRGRRESSGVAERPHPRSARRFHSILSCVALDAMHTARTPRR
ncbi:MAG TPA: hypothetical protein VM282_17890 [Acidimicrobiales bacterium]|nr:hypothetical protein [Acidimicrobiales bacterium]